MNRHRLTTTLSIFVFLLAAPLARGAGAATPVQLAVRQPATGQEAARQEAAGREAAGREAAGQEAPGKQATGQQSAPQQRATSDRLQGIGGQIIDNETRRSLEGVEVEALLRGLAVAATISDAEGNYRFAGLEPDLYTVVADAGGYQTAAQTEVRVVRSRVTIVNFGLARAGAISEEVVVSAKLSADDPRAPVTSFVLSREEIRRSPGTGGDILRAMDTLPGTTSTGEFSSFQVRGRGPRDNLILVDEIPFDRVTHFDQTIGEGEDVAGGGRFSIFAPNLIQDASFLPGGFPAAYSGKNGSLLRLTVAEGNRVTPVFSGRAEVTGWEVGYEGPTYLFDNTAALFSARGQYFGPLLEWVSDGSIGSPTLYDVIAKTTSDLGPRDDLSVLGVIAPERFQRTVDNVLAGFASEADDADFSTFLADTRQDTYLLGATWRRLVGDTGFLSNTFYYRYSDKFSSQGDSFPDQATAFPPTADDVPLREDILVINEDEQEFGWRGDFNFLAGQNGTVAIGGRITRSRLDYDVALDGPWINFVYDQEDFRPDPDQKFIVLRPEFINNDLQETAWRPAAYGEYALGLGDRVTLTPGLRLDYDGFSGETLLSPRFSASLLAGPRTRLNFSAGVFYQAPRFLQLAASPANTDLKNERSTQFAVGVSHYLTPDIRLAAEGYYQRLDDLIVIPDRTTNIGANSGDGTSYGIDLSLVKRITTRWFGQVGYSWAIAERDDNLGEPIYDADFNRPHVFNVFFAYELTSNLQVGAKWKYMSGRPTDDFIINENVFDNPNVLRFSKELTANNTLRFPAYHTLNFRVDYRLGAGPLDLIIFVDILNLYNHQNVNSFSFDPLTGRNTPQGLELFPTFGIKFEY